MQHGRRPKDAARNCMLCVQADLPVGPVNRKWIRRFGGGDHFGKLLVLFAAGAAARLDFGQLLLGLFDLASEA